MNSHSLVEHDAIAAAVIGVASLPVALDLWVNVFGFELIAQQVGAAANLESFWRLPTGSIKAQAVATTAGVNTGRVWLVEFAAPAEAVRHGTATIDRCPKSLNLALRDLPARYEEMLARGLRFRSPYVKYPAGAFDVYEAQLLAHDEVNVGLLEMIGLPFAFNERGSAGFTNFVSVVEDLAAETAFYHEVLGLPLLSEHRLRGAAIEKLIGLPPGATVAMNIFGVEENPYGRMQLIAYEGASGVDRYASARPPARGLLHPVWLTERFEEAPEQAGTSWRESEPQTMDTPLGKVNALRLRTPAGMRLDVYQYL